MKLVLTGAAGRLGSYLREPLAKLAMENGGSLISSDVNALEKTYDGETFVRADLENYQEIESLVDGADMVVHFGAIGDERAFMELLGPNIIGAYNVWEAAHQKGVRRVIYASSVHSVGMQEKSGIVDLDGPHRPDTYYGLAKCFAEDLARMYWEKRGIEAVCLRICSCAQVTNARALSTWLSYDDLILLVQRAIETPVVQFSLAWGVSDNERSMFDNRAAQHLGYRPRDNAEVFAKDILASEAQHDPQNLEHSRIGGPFAAVELGNSGLAMMDIIFDTKQL